MNQKDRDLDTLIDTAARELMSREPSRALTYEVMTRVGEHGRPTRGRLVWVVGTAGAVAICTVVAIVVMNRLSAPALQPPDAPLQTRVVEPVPAPVVEPAAVALDQPVRRPVVTPAQVFEEVPAMPMFELLTPEPIVLSALDLPPLESRPTTIDVIEIDDITIEPLTASNH